MKMMQCNLKSIRKNNYQLAISYQQSAFSYQKPRFRLFFSLLKADS